MSTVIEHGYQCSGALAFADATRHARHCRPGLWKICAILDADLANVLRTRNLHWTDAVIDDFGNLVPVPPPNQERRYSVVIRTPDGQVESYMRQGGCSIDHSAEAMERAGLGARIRVREVLDEA